MHTMENSMEVPQKLKLELPYDLFNSISGHLSEKSETLTLKYIWTTYYVHCSIYNIQAMETSKYLSINKWIKKLWYIWQNIIQQEKMKYCL